MEIKNDDIIYKRYNGHRGGNVIIKRDNVYFGHLLTEPLYYHNADRIIQIQIIVETKNGEIVIYKDGTVARYFNGHYNFLS